MAKAKRFPSDANKPKAGEKPAAKPAAGPLPAITQAPSQKTVQVEYKRENNHILGIGAHALANGINTLPEIVWNEALKHPSIKRLIADGHLIPPGKIEEDLPPPPADSGLTATDSDEVPSEEKAAE